MIQELTVDIHARKGQTATTEDATLQGAAVHFDVDIASHTTVRVIGVHEVTSAAKDIAVPSGKAVFTDVGIVCNFDIGTS